MSDIKDADQSTRDNDRIHFRHSAFENEGHQGAGITRGRYCHGLQADRCGAGSLAGRQRPPPVALVRTGAVFHKGKLLERPTDIAPADPTATKAITAGTEVA